MTRAIDHAVLAVERLDRAAERFRKLGFTLTPRAAHEDHMGTANRLAQFAGGNFIELLEVDRPRLLDEHQPQARPPRFSFGAHNRDFLAGGDGMSMLVFASDDAAADVARFARRGLQTYQVFDFERQARLPDGDTATVAFRLGFVTSPMMPSLAVFVCENRAPEHFWKPQYQTHDNGARSIETVYLSAARPEPLAEFFAALFDGETRGRDGGVTIACGPAQSVCILEPDALTALAPGPRGPDPGTPRFAGLAITTEREGLAAVPATAACGVFIRWRRDADPAAPASA